MTTTKYVIMSRFNSDTEVAGRCHVECLSEDWIRRRIAIFNQYTRRSLERQTNKDFLAVLTVQSESMALVKKILEDYPPLPSYIIFTDNKHEVVTSYVKEADKLYLSMLDSDDMYRPEFIQYLHDYKEAEDETMLVFRKGYIYNAVTDVIDHYEYVMPPFYTQIFTVETYLKSYQYYKIMRHYYMKDFKQTPIEERMFLIVLHNTNSFPHYQKEYPRLFRNEKILADEAVIKQQYGIESLRQ